MARYETTGGDVYYTIPYCDCGLTGGCNKCQPLHISAMPPYTNYKPNPSFDGEQFYQRDIDPKTHEERFLDDDLREFYRKKGYLYEGE